jgi:hypothetical protein
VAPHGTASTVAQLEKAPTRKGLYIKSGRKVVVK